MPKHSSNGPVSRRRFIKTTAVGSAVALAGCSGGDGGSGDGGGGSGGDGGSDGSSSDGGSSGGGSPTEITFWHQEGVPHRKEQFQRFTDRFNEEHDEVQVTVEGQTWGSVFSKLTSAIEAGNPPDFMFSLPAFTMTFQSRGDLVDVSDIVSDLQEEHDMYENTISPFQYDGGTWGIPMWDMVFLNHFRTDTLGQTDAWPPQNWDEWLQAASSMTDGDNYGIVLPAASNLWTTENLYNLMINKDSYVYGPDGNVMFDTPETVEVLDFYKQMFNQASPPGATGWGWGQWETSLLQGTAHSTTGFSSWMRRLTETQYSDDFGAMQQPYPDDGQAGSIHYVNDIMVFNEEKKDAIGTFVKWLHSAGTYGEWLANTEPTLYLPVTATGENSDDFWNHEVVSQYESSVQAQFEALPDARLYGFRDIHVENDLYIPSVGTLESSNVLADVVQQLVVSDRSPEEAASWGQSKLEEALGVGPSSQLN
ncbi:ABC transporter substrate-binding protein [Halomicroarcula sp. GCM10025324]|uniref:ABC transporter substrate-binding protein n=1 Tax=Haloarcula TaxID=2237 RepID=UPI0023E8562D|nr:substrate-binding domain-containing protein [Halomicroarcula sp. ZS-22-S1]